jgi:hypothetical protein
MRYGYLSPGAMKLISALLATALMLPVAAFAADRMPAKLVGDWCLDQSRPSSIDNQWTFTRTTTCPHGFRKKLRADGTEEFQDGLDGPRGKCKLVQTIVIKPNDYVMRFQCMGEGFNATVVNRRSVDDDVLVVTVFE